VAVTGSTGLIGSGLVRCLAADGHTVTRLTRSSGRGPGEARWDPAAGTVDAGALAAADAVVHLAGRPIASGRWTDRARREIRDSRVQGTRLLAETMARLGGGGSAGRPRGPRVLVVSSAIGYYGDRGDEVLTEASPPGDGFLAGVCKAWEAAADPARAAGLRVVHVRTGLVLTPEGGSLPKLLPLFKLGLGGRFGSGRQWWSWVALDDVLGIYRHALVTDGLHGPVNATAPGPVTNAELAATLARVLGRPALVPVPRFGPRLVLGEMADELLFSSARVQPEAALASGYAFRRPQLEPALRALLHRPAAAQVAGGSSSSP